MTSCHTAKVSSASSHQQPTAPVVCFNPPPTARLLPYMLAFALALSLCRSFETPSDGQARNIWYVVDASLSHWQAHVARHRQESVCLFNFLFMCAPQHTSSLLHRRNSQAPSAVWACMVPVVHRWRRHCFVTSRYIAMTVIRPINGTMIDLMAIGMQDLEIYDFRLWRYFEMTEMMLRPSGEAMGRGFGWDWTPHVPPGPPVGCRQNRRENVGVEVGTYSRRHGCNRVDCMHDDSQR